MQFWNLKIKMRIFGIQMEISKLLVKLIYVLQHISGDVAQKVASQSEKIWTHWMFWSALFLSSTELCYTNSGVKFCLSTPLKLSAILFAFVFLKLICHFLSYIPQKCVAITCNTVAFCNIPIWIPNILILIFRFQNCEL